GRPAHQLGPPVTPKLGASSTGWRPTVAHHLHPSVAVISSVVNSRCPQPGHRYARTFFHIGSPPSRALGPSINIGLTYVYVLPRNVARRRAPAGPAHDAATPPLRNW